MKLHMQSFCICLGVSQQPDAQGKNSVGLKIWSAFLFPVQSSVYADADAEADT